MIADQRSHALILGRVAEALSKVRTKYTDPKAIYRYVELPDDVACGVFGDGENGAYEWFTWRDGRFESSNICYGSPEAALRDGLKRALEKQVLQWDLHT